MTAPGATSRSTDGSAGLATCAVAPVSAAASSTLLLSGAAAAAAGLAWWLLNPGGRRAVRSWCRRCTSAESCADAMPAGGNPVPAKTALATCSAEAPNLALETAEAALDVPAAGRTAAGDRDACEIDTGTEGPRSRHCNHDSASSALSSPAHKKPSALGLLSGR